MPTYKVRWADEAAWIAVLGSIATLAGLIMADAGIKTEIVTATTALIGTAGRLLIGALLPTPE